MQSHPDKEVKAPEQDPVYLAVLERQAELDEHQTQYEKGTIEL